jgi:hypothetical protein
MAEESILTMSDMPPQEADPIHQNHEEWYSFVTETTSVMVNLS